jgi:hypothetical protein
MLYDAIIVLAICVGIFAMLYVRKNMKVSHETRVVPFREALVPTGFWKLCQPSREPTIVWIIRHYIPERRGAAELMAHDVNKYFVDGLGWKVLVITPYSSVKSYNGVPIMQFYEKTDIELALAKAHCILCQGDVVETAAITAQRCKLPLVLFSYDRKFGPWIEKAKSLCKNVNLVNTVGSEAHGLNSIVLGPPVDWRRYVTQTERRYITLVNLSSANGSKEFFEIAAALPEYEFLAVADSYENAYSDPKSSNVTLWNYQIDMRVVYNVTGILCIFSEGQERFGIEAAASGIPIAGPVRGLGDAALELNVDIIRKLKTDGLYYKKYSELSAKRAKEVNPNFEKFKVWIEDLERF